MSELRTALDNPYWDAVRDHVKPGLSLWRTPAVDWLAVRNDLPRRKELVALYSWTVSDPVTVAFVAEHARGRVVDPMAGTGYWAWLLAQLGVDVVAYDLNPPAVGRTENFHHPDTPAYATVQRATAVESVLLHPDRTLLLSWPPYGFSAEVVLKAYQGDRVVYMGEMEGGCCADDALFEAFERDWVEVAERVPVQWDALHDRVVVYDRRGGTS